MAATGDSSSEPATAFDSSAEAVLSRSRPTSPASQRAAMMVSDEPPAMDEESQQRYAHYLETAVEESQLPRLSGAMLEFDPSGVARVHPPLDLVRASLPSSLTGDEELLQVCALM